MIIVQLIQQTFIFTCNVLLMRTNAKRNFIPRSPQETDCTIINDVKRPTSTKVSRHPPKLFRANSPAHAYFLFDLNFTNCNIK